MNELYEPHSKLGGMKVLINDAEEEEKNIQEKWEEASKDIKESKKTNLQTFVILLLSYFSFLIYRRTLPIALFVLPIACFLFH
jgi:hypothetical protein